MDFEKTISIFGAIFIIGVIALLFWLSVQIEKDNKSKNQIVKECFYNINSHKDCKWILYEHENEKAVELSSTVMPVPIVIHH